MKFTIYYNSFLATFFSILGSCMAGGGILALLAGEIGFGIFLILFGFGGMLLASEISASKARKEAEKQAEQERAAREAQERAVREAQERAAREAQMRIAQQSQYNNQQSGQTDYEKYWNEVLWKYSLSQISQDVNIMVEISNNAPYNYASKTFVMSKLRELNRDLADTIGWTCPKCGTRNAVAQDCRCGEKYFV